MPLLPREYAELGSLNTEGAKYLRPYMLSARPDLGLRGYVEPVDSSAYFVESFRADSAAYHLTDRKDFHCCSGHITDARAIDFVSNVS